MPPVVLIDERCLLDIAQNLVPGDYGALVAAVARHRHEVMGTLVYSAVHHRAAALLHGSRPLNAQTNCSRHRSPTPRGFRLDQRADHRKMPAMWSPAR